MHRILVILAVLTGGMSAYAQPLSSDAAPRVEEKPLSIIYVQDGKGTFIPILKGVRYEEISQFLSNRKARSDRTTPNRLSVTNLAIKAYAETGFVRLESTIEFTIQSNPDQNVGTNAEHDWIRIPLGFHQAYLESAPEFRGQGECRFVRDKTDGFVGWYRGDTDISLTITLKLVCPTTQVADSTQFSLTLPESTLSSLDAIIPGELNKADVVGGTISEEYSGEGSAIYTCVGLEREFRISWRQGAKSGSQIPARLDVEGEIDATIDRIGLISQNVKLDLKSNQEISTFDLRIPADSAIVSLDRSEYKARLRTAASNDEYKQYQVDISTAAKEHVLEFKIEATGRSDAEAPTNVAAIEVVGAIRQFGRVRIFHKPDLQVSWSTDSDVSRTNDPQLTSNDDLRASFVYTRQPCAVNVIASPRTTRTTVTPLHFVSVQAGRIYLRSVFRFQVRGGELSELFVKLGDWNYDYAGTTDSAELIDQYSEQDSTLRILLDNPISDEFELTVRSHKTIDSPDSELMFPRSSADSVSPAIVFVGAADNVTLEFENDNSTFLRDAIPTDLSSEVDAMVSTQPIRCFRMQSAEQPEPFSIQSTIHDQRVYLNVADLVKLASDKIQVVQQFDFDIQYERIQALRFELPLEVSDLLPNAAVSGSISTTVDGETVSAAEWARRIDTVDETTGKAMATIVLPDAKIGQLQIKINYELKRQDDFSDNLSMIDIPLIRCDREPSDFASSQLLVVPLDVRANGLDSGDDWLRNDQIRTDFPIDLEDGTSSQLLSLNAIGAVANSQPDRCRVSASQSSNAVTTNETSNESTQLDRVWIHSILTSSRRRDQAAFFLRTGGTQAQISMPNEPSAAAVRVWVNGKEVRPEASENNDVLTIPLDRTKLTDTVNDAFLIEAQLDFVERANVGTIYTSIPELLDVSSCQSWVWQVTIPDNEYLVNSDDDLVLTQPWTWSGWFFSRGDHHKGQLFEDWIGTSQLKSPPGGNSYVFTSLTPKQNVKLTTTSRRFLVTLASGAALAFGLMSIYIREFRRPIVLLLLAVFLAAAGLLFPGPAIMAAQASVVGVILAILGLCTAILIRRLSLPHHVLPTTVPSRHDSSSQLRNWVDGQSQAPTASLPVRTDEIVTADSKAS